MKRVFDVILYRKDGSWFIKSRINEKEWRERKDRKRKRVLCHNGYFSSRAYYPKEMFDLALEDFTLPKFAGWLIHLTADRGNSRYYRKTIDRTAEA